MKSLYNLNKSGLASLLIMAGVFSMVAYLIGSSALAQNGASSKSVVIKTDDKQDHDTNHVSSSALAPTSADFLKATTKCAKCHQKPFASPSSLKELKWVIPGKPEISPIYKVIGKHNSKKGGTYHNLSEAEKLTIFNYIKNMN